MDRSRPPLLLDRRGTGRTLVMGVLNVTPDSFSDGGDHLAVAEAVAAARRMAAEGADIIDIGGESTRPGAVAIDAETELQRIMPVIAELAASGGPPLSIDTYKASVADAALRAGVRIVNDVTGLRRDPAIAGATAAHDAVIVIGHWEWELTYGPGAIMDGMLRFFDRAIGTARAAGVADERIVIDPGLGFGKDAAENLAILADLPRLVALGHPVLVGASRKRFIGNLTGREPRERLLGTLGAHLVAAARGASIVRAHDVAPHREALAVADAILAIPAASRAETPERDMATQ
ncbi:dihydropteroate synthase [Kaistia geumhonensis]|uniref:Dihydropteroate synthase n=1 Tax=Kaistia geumhonensis TaxID=410839 RepID=A0ABU0M2F2_9HYPH|nr:dihydropteroate synthase [Kaistia geumhonensis]MCX5479671.1 dihydropteroate synthase [Kaistia geumhonensis]MDQ0515105.1 dihydropteroate synthase [Kaistia geumhonensis]